MPGSGRSTSSTRSTSRAGPYRSYSAAFTVRFLRSRPALRHSDPLIRAACSRHGRRGDAYHGLGRYREAAESLRRASPIFRDHALCLLKMGYAYQALGDHQAATGHLQESLDIFGRLQLTHYTQRALKALDACQDGRRADSGQLPDG